MVVLAKIDLIWLLLSPQARLILHPIAIACSAVVIVVVTTLPVVEAENPTNTTTVVPIVNIVFCYSKLRANGSCLISTAPKNRDPFRDGNVVFKT